jgi:hypothetical protein
VGKKKAVPPGGTASLAVLLVAKDHFNDASTFAVAAKPINRTTGLPPGVAAFLKLKTTVASERLIVNRRKHDL